MINIILIPIIITFIYGTYLLYNSSPKKAIITDSIIILVSIIIYLIFSIFFHKDVTLAIVLMVEIISLYISLRIGKAISIVFTILLVLTLVALLIIGVHFIETNKYLAFISVLVFMLAENNQIFMRKTYEESANEYQNKILDKQVEEVRNIYLTMRGWRHDYHNHLQKLKAHIKLNQIEEANNYLNELEIDLDNVNQLVESGNVNLDAILNSKISLALKNKIDISYKASVPKDLTVSDIDLCVLIGNLIDNAVEACEKVKEGTKFIRLYIGIFKKQLYISVSNATAEKIRKIDKEYITTKRGNHGHGLKRINNIVEKYQGFINRQNEPGVFVTEVMLPL